NRLRPSPLVVSPAPAARRCRRGQTSTLGECCRCGRRADSATVDCVLRSASGRSVADQVFAEYPVHATAAPTGRLTHHLFMAYLVAKNGKIALLREGLNTVAAASALLPGGAHDLPAPTNEVYAF